MRVILHVDLDYFYAQVEERDNPQLKGKPVVVLVLSGRTEESGVVATANYEARRLNVKSGMPITAAKRRLEGLEAYFIPMRKSYYRFISDDVMNIIRRHADIFEQASRDEAYLDVTFKVNGDFKMASELALNLQGEIYREARLTCSIGVSYNKLIAKIASGIKKPNGVTIIKPEETSGFLAPLDISRIPGIGVKTSEYLKVRGYQTVKELLSLSRQQLTGFFGGKMGEYIYSSIRGVDEGPVAPRGRPEQEGRMKTLKEDTCNPEYILESLEPLITSIEKSLSDRRSGFRTLSVVLITSDLKTHTKSKTYDHRHYKLHPLKPDIFKLIAHFTSNSLPIRRVGLKVSNLFFEGEEKQAALTSFLK